MVQQIVSSFYAFDIQSKDNLLNSFWLIDSTNSNHMTGITDALHNLHKNEGGQHIQIANDNALFLSLRLEL